MKHATNCKFCRIPITVEIDDDYASLGDPYKLIAMACCNRCADLRVDRRKLEDSIGRSCMILDRTLRRHIEEVRPVIREALMRDTKRYAELIARWHGEQGMAWDEEGVTLLLDKPRHWPKILNVYWQLFRDWQKQNRTEAQAHA